MEAIGIGLANIDLVAHVKDEFLTKHKVIKGGAKKFDDLAFARLRAELPQYDAIPGGCAANTICGMAAYGVNGRFYGKIGEDSFESLYRASFADYTVAYDVAAGAEESSQCAVLVTPDGERSFAYTHGASWDLGAGDLSLEALAQADMMVSEIYMFEFGRHSEVAKAVFEIAQQSKTPLVMKVMDQEFGRRYAQKIRALAGAGILNLLVGNHENLPSLTGGGTLQHTLDELKALPCDVLLTANVGGAYYISGGEVKHYGVEPMANPRNTTGAGDQFLAGFLMGRMDGKAPHECVDFAARCARTILMHDTARPPLVNRHSIRF
jgi:sugar/nucleoside kinase (ribokinase family)